MLELGFAEWSNTEGATAIVFASQYCINVRPFCTFDASYLVHNSSEREKKIYTVYILIAEAEGVQQELNNWKDYLLYKTKTAAQYGIQRERLHAVAGQLKKSVIFFFLSPHSYASLYNQDNDQKAKESILPINLFT